MAGRRLSRKKLAEALKEMGRLSPEFDYHNFSNEVYGKDARIYLHIAKNLKDRKILEDQLEQRGFLVNRNYGDRGQGPEDKVIEVKVSYFKGWHWDE